MSYTELPDDGSTAPGNRRGPDDPGEQDTSFDPHRPILRLALAMRGGVSLAVWIGGAVAEIDLLRRAVYNRSGGQPVLAATGPSLMGESDEREQQAEAFREERRSVYRDLLDLADVEEVQVDVLAGASAGGLNAVLYGTALANGRRIDDMRKVWSELAELDSLLRPTAKRRRSFVPSLLRGDEYFYFQLRDRLGKLSSPERSGTGNPASYLTVSLSATMLPQIDVNGVRERRERGADSGRGSFSLSHRPSAGEPPYTLSDLPTRDQDDRWRQFLVDRMALAGRATSSFPGAFEPARVHADESNPDRIAYYQRAERADAALEDVMSRYRRSPLITMPNMADVFSASRPSKPLESGHLAFSVVDGGVFDNIAVSRALAAIADSPAEVHTRRWLIYLDPDPSKAPLPRFGSIRPPAFTVPRLIVRLAGMRAASSTVRDDLEALQTHNERAQGRRATTDAYTRQLAAEVQETIRRLGDADQQQQAAALGDLATRRMSQDGTMRPYDRYRAATDLPRITRLLVRPQQVIGGQIRRRKLFDPWSEESVGEVMVQLREPLQLWYADRNRDLHCDLTAVMDTADLLIAWTRGLERWLYDGDRSCAEPGWRDDPGDRKRHKRVLYRVLFVATALRDIAEQEMLTEPLSPSLPRRVADVLDRVHKRQSAFRLPSELDGYFSPGPDEGRAVRTPRESDAGFYDAVGRYLAGDLSTPPDPLGEEVNDYFWRRLTELFEAIRRQSPMMVATCTDEAHRPWRDSPFHLLTKYPALVRPTTEDADQAPALSRLGPIYAGAGGLPDSTQMVAFEIFTADKLSPLYGEMRGLRQAVGTDWARAMLKGRMPDVSRSWLDSRSKLAGNNLANFAGFLDRRWRHNDWMWGRADCAANTVSLLMRQVNPAHFTHPTRAKSRVVDAARRLALWAERPLPDAWPEPGATDETVAEKLEELSHAVTRKLQIKVVDELYGPALGNPAAKRRREREGALAGLTTGQETPAVLPPRRRSGLLMHAGLLVARAMLPTPVGAQANLIRLGALLLRPVFVMALVCAMPARSMLILALVLAGAAASGAGGQGNVTVRTAVLGAVAVAGCTALALRVRLTRRRITDARTAAKRLAGTLEERRTVAPDGQITRVAAAFQRDARRDSVALTHEAVRVLDAVLGRRRALAWAFAFLFGLGGVAVFLEWDAVPPWLRYGNWASFASLALVELLILVVGWRLGDGPLRARTGRRRAKRPRFVWLLAVMTFAVTVLVGHLPGVVDAINLPRRGDPLAWNGDITVAIMAGSALVCALVLVSTYDWMNLRWLPACWAAAVAVYLVGFGLQLWLGFAVTLASTVLVAGVAYMFSFAYVISVYAASRYPPRPPDGLAEPPNPAGTVRFGESSTG